MSIKIECRIVYCFKFYSKITSIMNRKFEDLVNGHFHLVEVLSEKKTAISDCRCIRFYRKRNKRFIQFKLFKSV